MNKNYQMILENKVKNSRHNIARNFLYYAIAPVVILLVSLIICCTVGFNYGIDFTGGSTLTVYVNNDGIYTDAESYDLSDAKEYSIVLGKIEEAITDANCTLIDKIITNIDIKEDLVFGGQAIKVTYQNHATTKEKIEIENETIKNRILANFEYTSYQNAVTNPERIAPSYSFAWLGGIIGGLLFAVLACTIYFAIRFGGYAIVLTIMQVALDLIVSLGLIAIFRIPLNLTISAVLAVIIVLALVNSFVILNKTRESALAGKYTKMSNTDMADMNIKELAVKRGIIYVALALTSLIFVILSTNGFRMASLGILLSVFASFYTSTFVMGGIWAAIYKPKKKKKRV